MFEGIVKDKIVLIKGDEYQEDGTDVLIITQKPEIDKILNSITGYSLPKGTSDQSLRKYIGTLSKEDADDMRKAIEEGCEKIDYESW